MSIRQPYGKKRGTCASCGKVMWRGSTSLPDGEAKCLPCRRANPPMRDSRAADLKRKQTPCADCGQPSHGARCKACHIAKQKAEADPVAAARRKRDNRRRLRLERAAPGLTKNQRYKLLHQWRKQGKRCAYCAAPVQCVDHVIPLALGGTSLEGNLTPACRDCNQRKSDSLLIEWRAKKRIARTRVEPPPYEPTWKAPKRWATEDLPMVRTCPRCSGWNYSPRSDYCHTNCQRRAVFVPKLNMQSRPCETCGVTMVTKVPTKRYCSDWCTAHSANGRAAKRRARQRYKARLKARLIDADRGAA